MVLVHIVFHVMEIGNSLENQLVKVTCINISYAIDNYVVRFIRARARARRKVYCQTLVHLCVNKCHLHRSLFLVENSPQNNLDILLRLLLESSRWLAMPLDFPTSNRFCTFVASESSFRKRSRTLGCTFVSDVGIIDCTCSYDRSSNLRRVAEDSNVMLFFSSFSSCSFSSSFLSRLVTDAASLWRNSLFIARTPGL